MVWTTVPFAIDQKMLLPLCLNANPLFHLETFASNNCLDLHIVQKLSNKEMRILINVCTRFDISVVHIQLHLDMSLNEILYNSFQIIL